MILLKTQKLQELFSLGFYVPRKSSEKLSTQLHSQSISQYIVNST